MGDSKEGDTIDDMYLLFDIGGTNTRIAGSEDLTSFFDKKTFATPKRYEEGIALFKKEARVIAGDKQIKAIAGGIAGPLDRHKRSLVGNLNLKDWIGKPLQDALEKEFLASVRIENDAALAGLGEAVFGAGRGYAIVAYITVSTGVGGARIVNGKIDEKTIGFEPGHQIIDREKRLELEDYIGGAALEKKFGVKPSEIEDQSVWDEVALFLAYGLHNTIVHWSPEAVVLGGSLMNKIDIEKVMNNLKMLLKIFPEMPALKKAELGDAAGLYGAMAYLRQH